MSDIISRQAALERFRSWLSVKGYSTGELNMLKAVLCELEAMPSVEPTHVNASNTLKTLDCISRQAAIDAVCKDCEYYYNENVIQNIKDIPSAQPEQRWIPCSERLPEKPNMYTVTDSKGDVVRFVFYDTESSRKYWLRCAKAWMPLPEPYNGGEQNG